MNSAQGQHRRDLESKLRYHPTLSSPNEKDAWEEHAGRRSETMSKLPQYVVTVLLLLGLVAVGIVSATAHHQALQAAPLSLSPEESRFRELLNSVDPAALHDVLHEKIKDKYQHGVFQEDRTAMEAIHRQNAEVAENLIELAKRQAGSSGNGTVVTTTSVTTTDSVTVSIVSDTSTPSSTAAAASAESTTSPAPSSTGLSAEQSSSALPSSQPAASAVGSAITSAEASSSATGGVSTSLGGSTTARPSSTGSTPASTSHTPTSTASIAQSLSKSQDGSKTTASSSQTTIYTTTIANGVLSTVTSVKIIPAGQADQTAGSGSATTTPGNPSLQTGAGGRFTVGFSAVLGGAVMAFMGAL